MVIRSLNLLKILGNDRSAFLFGPRGVGKTVISKDFLGHFEPSFEIDLLDTDLYKRYLTTPSLFRREVEGRLRQGQILTVFVDEVQKVPSLLNEIHLLIEKYKGMVRFLLTGSSARKLKRGGADLLAGRAWTLNLHPLTHKECPLEMDRALKFGTLPAIYLTDNQPERTLKAYVETYLKEEIMQEAIVRRIEGFVKFLDVAGQMNGEPVNFTNVSRDCNVSTKTAQDYFSILVDTLIAFRVEGWTKSVRKQLQHSPKFYFFDCGVLNAIRGELKTELKESSYRYGKLFESFIIQEIIRLNDYYESGYKFYYWRTNSGSEVDIILSRGAFDKPIAIEIKSKPNPVIADCRGLLSFSTENPDAKLICISTSPHFYQMENVSVYPWKEAMEIILNSSPNVTIQVP